jgi:hypothetical protein
VPSGLGFQLGVDRGGKEGAAFEKVVADQRFERGGGLGDR